MLLVGQHRSHSLHQTEVSVPENSIVWRPAHQIELRRKLVHVPMRRASAIDAVDAKRFAPLLHDQLQPPNAPLMPKRNGANLYPTKLQTAFLNKALECRIVPLDVTGLSVILLCGNIVRVWVS